MNIEIQPLREEDIPRAMELKNALGWNQTPEDWRRFLQLGIWWQRESPLYSTGSAGSAWSS